MSMLDSIYAVDDTHIANFQQNGWVRLNGVLPEPELAPHRDAIIGHTMGFAESRGVVPMAQRNTYGKAFIQYSNLWRCIPMSLHSRWHRALPRSPLT